MDGKKDGGNNSKESGWRWTNERHLNFLSKVEATFVRRMFEKNDRMNLSLPDCSESTVDLIKIDKRRRHSTSSDILDPRIQNNRRTITLLDQPCTSLQDDQVVPEYENSPENPEDEKGRSGFPIIPATPSN